jgi:hypothetical protein
MARLEGIKPEDASELTRSLMERDLKQHGFVLPGTEIFGYAPTIQEGTRALDAGITAAGRISPQLRRLMNVRVAATVGCPF